MKIVVLDTQEDSEDIELLMRELLSQEKEIKVVSVEDYSFDTFFKIDYKSAYDNILAISDGGYKQLDGQEVGELSRDIMSQFLKNKQTEELLAQLIEDVLFKNNI